MSIELRYYKGYWPIEILQKGKKQWKVKFLYPDEKPEGFERVFITIPRLCHRDANAKRRADTFIESDFFVCNENKEVK